MSPAASQRECFHLEDFYSLALRAQLGVFHICVSASPMLNANASIVFEFLFFFLFVPTTNTELALLACHIFFRLSLFSQRVFFAMYILFLRLVLQLDGKVCFAES